MLSHLDKPLIDMAPEFSYHMYMRKGGLMNIQLFEHLSVTYLAITCLTVTCFLLTVAAAPLQAGSRDVFSTTQKSAIKYRKLAARASWQQTVTFEAADFIEELPGNRLLVGSVASGSRLGIPRHGPLFLFDKSSGKELWKANRSSLPNGEYTLYATSPLIVLGGLERYLNIIALEPTRGKQKWSLKLPKESVVEVDGSSLFALSKTDSELSLYDILTGRLRWSIKSQVTRLAKERNPRILIDREQIYVVGLGIQCYERKSGRIKWQVGNPSFIDDTAVLSLGDRLCLWSKDNTMVVNEKTGQLLWQQKKCKKGAKALYYLGGHIYRVLKGSDEDDFIECLNPKDGSVIWQTKIKDNVVSPLVKAKDALHFTGDKAIYSLLVKNGKSRFFTPLPERFTRNSPTFAPLLGTPDMISIVGEKMWVWRDRAGVLAVALPLGKIICQHYPLLPIPDYNVNDATNLLFQVRNIVPQNIKSGGVIPLHEPGPNPFLLAAERRHADVMSNKRSDSLDVNISSSHVMSQTKISSAFNQAQAAVNMGVSMIAAAQAIRQMNKMRAQEGLKQRYAMQARAIMGRKLQAFQGDYFIEPFLARGIGMGLTLISLKSGKRRDFLYSPLVAPLLDFSVDLLTYRLDSRRERLYLVGVGMDEKKYVPMKKWRWRLPRVSLIAYDLSSIPWSTENRIGSQTPGGGQGKVLSPEEIQKIVEAALKAQGIKPPKAGAGGGAAGGGASRNGVLGGGAGGAGGRSGRRRADHRCLFARKTL